MYSIKESINMHFQQQTTKSWHVQFGFCQCFITVLLTQHNFEDINLTNRRWRTRQMNHAIPPMWSYCGHLQLHKHFSPWDWLENNLIQLAIVNPKDWFSKCQN